MKVCFLLVFIPLLWKPESCAEKWSITCFQANRTASLPIDKPKCTQTATSGFLGIAMTAVSYGYMKNSGNCTISVNNSIDFRNKCEESIVGSSFEKYKAMIGYGIPLSYSPSFPTKPPSCPLSPLVQRFTMISYECKHMNQSQYLNQLCSWNTSTSDELLISNEDFPYEEINISNPKCYCTIKATTRTPIDLRTYYSDLHIGQSLLLEYFNGTVIYEWKNGSTKFLDSFTLSRPVSGESLRLSWSSNTTKGRLWIGIKALSGKLTMSCQPITTTSTSTTPITTAATTTVTATSSSGGLPSSNPSGDPPTTEAPVSSPNGPGVPHGVKSGNGTAKQLASTGPGEPKSNVGLIVGVVAGIVFVVIVILVSIVIVYKKKKRPNRVGEQRVGDENADVGTEAIEHTRQENAFALPGKGAMYHGNQRPDDTSGNGGGSLVKDRTSAPTYTTSSSFPPLVAVGASTNLRMEPLRGDHPLPVPDASQAFNQNLDYYKSKSQINNANDKDNLPTVMGMPQKHVIDEQMGDENVNMNNTDEGVKKKKKKKKKKKRRPEEIIENTAPGDANTAQETQAEIEPGNDELPNLDDDLQALLI